MLLLFCHLRVVASLTRLKCHVCGCTQPHQRISHAGWLQWARRREWHFLPGKEQMQSVQWCTHAAASAFLMEERLQRYVCHQIAEKWLTTTDLSCCLPKGFACDCKVEEYTTTKLNTVLKGTCGQIIHICVHTEFIITFTINSSFMGSLFTFRSCFLCFCSLLIWAFTKIRLIILKIPRFNPVLSKTVLKADVSAVLYHMCV